MGCLARSCTTVPAQTFKIGDEGDKDTGGDSSSEKAEETDNDKD